jgi:hypothetical protein
MGILQIIENGRNTGVSQNKKVPDVLGNRNMKFLDSV